MKRKLVFIISFLAMTLIVLASCSEPQQNVPGSVDMISVRVVDNIGAKTITPEGNVNVSHYVITVVNEVEGIEQSSEYLTRGSMFTVSNVPAGEWYAKVDAYIDRGNDTYVKVASDQSEPQNVAAGVSTTFTLVLDTLDEVASGDVTVTLKMPTALSAQGTTFWYQYTITELADSDPFSYTSSLTSGTTGADGLATVAINAEAIGLMQGAYRFEITVQDAQSSPSVSKKGVDVMRLINGLEAAGAIDLCAYESNLTFDVTITNKIGDILTPTLVDGQEVYNLDGQNGSASLTVTLTEPLTTSQTIDWYVDGELDESVNTDEAASGEYTLTFTAGNHIVNAIVRDTGTLIAVGSIDEFKVSLTTTEFIAKVFTFALDGDSYSIVGLVAPVGQFEMPASGVLEIPATYNGRPVTKINSAAFYNRTDIIGSIIIPESVTSIGKSAFSGCSSLESVAISDSSQLKIIEEAAFFGCSSLTDINIPESVIELGLSSFNGCSSLTSIIIPDGVTSIGNYAFYNCSKLVTVEISDTSQLVIIGSYAFQNCSSLTSITIPDGVTSIGDFVFADCSALETVEISDTSQLVSLGRNIFDGCSSLISIIIPNGVTSIGGLAFKDCSSLSSINISESVTLIGQSAFSGCSELQNLIIPNGIVEIGYEAFKDCTSLTTVEISKNSKLEKIEGSVFYGCFALSNISPIPASVDSCGSLVFSNCFSLDNVYCEAATQPSTWTSNWLGNCPAEVHWGYTGE